MTLKQDTSFEAVIALLRRTMATLNQVLDSQVSSSNATTALAAVLEAQEAVLEAVVAQQNDMLQQLQEINEKLDPIVTMAEQAVN